MSVTIYLPIAVDRTVAAPQDRVPLHHGEGETVLLVEGDSSVRLPVSDVLEEPSYRAVEAAEPHAGLRLIESGVHFDLMIINVGLPSMNGRLLAEIARGHLPDLPMSALGAPAINAVGQQAATRRQKAKPVATGQDHPALRLFYR